MLRTNREEKNMTPRDCLTCYHVSIKESGRKEDNDSQFSNRPKKMIGGN